MYHLQKRLEALDQRTHTVARQLRWCRGLAGGLLVLAVLTWALPAGTAQEDTRGSDKGLEQRVAALEQLLKHFTRIDNEVFITRANLHIVNGLGSTDCLDEQFEPIPDCPNGLGNLIVGYNEPRVEDVVRTGSHNVVVGAEHNFSRFGGLVVGVHNEISGDWSAVSGGRDHTASGPWSSVSGGAGNTASEDSAAVSGGQFNTASGSTSWVGGGGDNTASDFAASASGGFGNTASGDFSVVSGGRNITQEIEGGWSAGSEGNEVFVGNFRSP